MKQRRQSGNILMGLMLLLLVVVGFVFYRFLQQSPSVTPYTGPKEKITIANIGEYTIFNLIAQDQGYFAENGLDAQIIEHSSGPAALAALLAGKVDFAIAADFVGVRNIFGNPDLRILAQANQHRVFNLITRKDRGINNPSDVKGKRIGVTKNSAGEYFLGNFLTFHNLKLADVKLVDLTPAEMKEQLKAGKIDGIVVFQPHVYQLQKEMGPTLNMWDVQVTQNTSALVFTTNSYIQAHPQIADRYIQALVQANQYYLDYPAEVKALLARKMHYDAAYIDQTWPHFTHAITLNQELLLNMEAEARWAIANKLTTATEVPNYLDYIYFAPLEKSKKDSITIIY